MKKHNNHKIIDKTSMFNYILLGLVLTLSITTAHTQTPGFHIEPTHNVLFGDSMTNAGIKFMWIPEKGALRAGEVGGLQWDIDSIGPVSSAFGINNTVKGVRSMAWNLGNDASGSSSTSWGEATSAIGDVSTSWGTTTEARGDFSTTWGDGTKALGTLSTSWGGQSEAAGYAATAWGTLTKAKGIESTAFGKTNSAIGELATTWGQNNKATSLSETVMGQWADTTVQSDPRVWDVDDQLLAVGNGTADDARNNALTVYKNGELYLHTQPENAGSIFISKREGPKYGGAGTFDFSTNANEGSGFVLESKVRADATAGTLLESSGIYGDGQSIHIWSPGDENLLNVHDEDGMETGTSLKWSIDGNGTPSSLVEDAPTKSSLDKGSILDKALKVNSITYYRQETAPKSGQKAQSSQLLYNFDPISLKKQFPDLVTTNEHGNHYVKYSGMIPLLLEAIKAQQEIINIQQLDNENLLERIERLERLILEKE